MAFTKDSQEIDPFYDIDLYYDTSEDSEEG